MQVGIVVTAILNIKKNPPVERRSNSTEGKLII
jgi:hypothetical protein